MKAEVNGTEHELELDWDAIAEREAQDKNWSIVDELQSVSEKKRISTMNLLVGFIKMDGKPIFGGWEGYIASGLTVEDLVEVYREGLQRLGFI